MNRFFDREGRAAEIMVVDDNRGDAILASRAFKKSEVETNLTVAETGEKAMSILSQSGDFEGKRLPDLILLDLNLPRMSGMDVLARVKTSETLKHIPVIILSSSSAEKDVSESYSLHASGYVIKPASLEQFGQFVAAVEGFFFNLAVLSGPKSPSPSAG